MEVPEKDQELCLVGGFQLCRFIVLKRTVEPNFKLFFNLVR